MSHRGQQQFIKVGLHGLYHILVIVLAVRKDAVFFVWPATKDICSQCKCLKFILALNEIEELLNGFWIEHDYPCTAGGFSGVWSCLAIGTIFDPFGFCTIFGGVLDGSLVSPGLGISGMEEGTLPPAAPVMPFAIS